MADGKETQGHQYSSVSSDTDSSLDTDTSTGAARCLDKAKPFDRTKSLGTLNRFPLGIRQMIYAHLYKSFLCPALSPIVGVYWPCYSVLLSVLLISRGIKEEVVENFYLHQANATDLPTLVIKAIDIEEFVPLKPALTLARRNDIAWLKEHNPAEKDNRVADEILDESMEILYKYTESGGPSPEWYIDMTARDWKNMRDFLSTTLLRLRNSPTLNVRILMMLGVQDMQYATENVVCWETGSEDLVVRESREEFNHKLFRHFDASLIESDEGSAAEWGYKVTWVRLTDPGWNFIFDTMLPGIVDRSHEFPAIRNLRVDVASKQELEVARINNREALLTEAWCD